LGHLLILAGRASGLPYRGCEIGVRTTSFAMRSWKTGHGTERAT
jgi:hypothetical protein